MHSLITLGVQVIDLAKCCDEKSLNYTLYSQAYHNFLKCMETCIPPGSLLPWEWDTYFLGSLKGPWFMAEWWVFPYMDIKMRQQLVNSPFTPETGSPLYWDGYNISVAQLCREEDRVTWLAIRQHEST